MIVLLHIDLPDSHLKDIGEREGKYYAINIPLKDVIDDSGFTRLFKTVSPLYITISSFMSLFSLIKLCMSIM